ncbi:MAG: hypothetical protein ACFFDW_17425, partial [Candidatus Thorarchaeota archaeon]
LGAIIAEAIAAFSVLIVMGFLFKKYFDRRREAALSLAVAFGFWGSGGLSVFIFALLQYIYRQPINDIELLQYASWGINIGYALSAISNIFMVLFVSQIYSQTILFRQTKKVIPIINAILNGITIGLVLNTLSSNPQNPLYPIPQTVYHLLLTFMAFGMIIGFSSFAYRNASLRWEKGGFGFIISSGVFGILVYLSFALDVILPDIVPALEGGYTPFNYLGWAFAVLMALFAYAGYAMPEGLRNMFKEEAAK